MASTVIQPTSSISARIDKTGGRSARLIVTGYGSARIRFTLEWNDNPNTNGDAIDNIKLNGMQFDSPGETGNTSKSAIFTPGNYNIDMNGLIQDIQVPNNNRINFFDNDGNDNNAIFTLDSITNINPPSFTLSATISAAPQTMVSTNVFTLGWNTSNATTATINGSGVSANGSRSENTGLQSVAGSTSPASKTYTLTACSSGTGYPLTCVSESITVYVYNDNTPNSFSISSLNNLEPNTQYTTSVGPITGIDVATTVTGSSGLDFSVNGSNWSSTLSITNNTSFFVRTTSLSFNTDPNGLVNNKTCYVDVGTIRRYFDVQTRAPNVQEIFDYGDTTNAYPYPDIDAISNTPIQYLVSPTTLTVDNIELSNPYGVEMKSDQPETQVSIKTFGSSTFGAWKYLRQFIFNLSMGSIGARTGTVSNPNYTKISTRNSGILTSVNAKP